MFDKTFTIRFVIENFPDLDTAWSKQEEHFGLRWTLKADRNDENFGLFLHCNPSKETDQDWSVTADMWLRVASFNDYFPTEEREKKTFDADNKSWGFEDIELFENMMLEHMVDDTVIVECEVAIEKITGIAQKRKLSFDEPKEGLTDVVLKVGDKKFHVSKAFLATLSPYFNTMFLNPNFNESKQSEIELKDKDPEGFQQFLEVLQWESSIQKENVCNVLKMAQFYQVDMVFNRCVEFLMGCKEMTDKEKFLIADECGLENVKRHFIKNVKDMDGLKELLPGDVRTLDSSTILALFEKTLLLG